MRSTIVIFVLTFAILGLMLGISESFDPGANNALEPAVMDIENRIAGYVQAMQASAELAEVKSTGNLTSISTDQMGIPQNEDQGKRGVARQVLADNPEFESIFFLTPAGDVYLGEPFEQQEQLPRLNYADRDWYLGANSTGKAYVSAVFMSAAINAPAIAVAVPVRADGEIAGYWVSIVDLGDFTARLADIGGEARVLLVDHIGIEIADTGNANQTDELRSHASLQSVQRALSGESGRLTEGFDGVEMTATYAPVDANPNTWAVVFLEPTS